jgi:hypothetical protein
MVITAATRTATNAASRPTLFVGRISQRRPGAEFGWLVRACRSVLTVPVPSGSIVNLRTRPANTNGKASAISRLGTVASGAETLATGAGQVTPAHCPSACAAAILRPCWALFVRAITGCRRHFSGNGWHICAALAALVVRVKPVGRSEHAAAAFEQQHIAPAAVVSADPLARADDSEPGGLVQRDAGRVLGEDA